jgi:hypothetical protein
MYGTGFNVLPPNPAPHASDAYAWAVGVWAIVLGLVGAVTAAAIGEDQLDHAPDHQDPVDQRLTALEADNPH